METVLEQKTTVYIENMFNYSETLHKMGSCCFRI